MSGQRNTKRTLSSTDKRSFYLVGNDVFLGLVFSAKQSYYYKNNRTLVSTPSILFYTNQTKAIIDYSNSKNEDDLSYVSSFFNSLDAGQTFSVSNATYVEDGSEIRADISGTYTFESFEQGKIVKASVVSTSRLSSKKDSYIPKFFTTIPQLSKTGGVSSTQQKSNIIKNTLSNGLFSFKRMGVQINDYIEFSGTSNNKWKKLKIIDLFTDTDGYETIQVDGTVTDENLIGQPVLVNLYFTGDPQTDSAKLDKTYGTCVTVFANNSSTCFPCQNNFLCAERAKKLNAVSSSYTENTTCDDINVSDVTAALTSNTATLLQGITSTVEVTTGETLATENLSIALSLRPKTSFKSETVKIETIKGSKTFTIDGNAITDIPTTVNTTLKLVLSDPSLSGYIFTISSTDPKDKITQVPSISITNGTPGTAGAYVSLQTGKVAKTFYFTTTDRKLSTTITVK